MTCRALLDTNDRSLHDEHGYPIPAPRRERTGKSGDRRRQRRKARKAEAARAAADGVS